MSAANPLAAGLQLTGLNLTTPSGKISFAPVAPVTIFALPATENATFTGVGFDPATGTSLVVQGRIVPKDRVLGCGEGHCRCHPAWPPSPCLKHENAE